MSDFSVGGYIEATIRSSFKNPYDESSDEYWMFEALIESMREVGKAAPNPTVGCVYVKDGKLIAKGATQEFGSLHGERYAASLVEASELEGATAYVTLEPCSHYGSQPPCAELLVDLKIKRVVIAMIDPFSKVKGKGVEFLEKQGVAVTLGILQDEVRLWHLPFTMYLKKKSPLLIAKWAQTLDGNLADDFGKSKWITGADARAYTHFLRQKYDTILVGAGTVIADKPSLDVRDCQLNINRHPVKIIFDPTSRLIGLSDEIYSKLQKKCFSDTSEVIYLGSKEAFSYLCDQFNMSLFEHIEWSKKSDLGKLPDELNKLYKKIFKKDLQTIFVEGGPRLHSLFLEANMYDILHSFINPSIVGSSKNKLGKSSKVKQLKMENKNEYDLLGSYSLTNDVLIDSCKRY